jgi:putative PEP-CTERM system histidine kinase
MSFDFPALIVLHGACAFVYAVLCALILVRPPLSRTAAWLALACLITALWAVSVVVFHGTPTSGAPSWLELARSAAWYAFILHLYRRSVARGQLMQAFSTMGLLAFLVVGGLVLTNLVEGQTPGTLWLVGVGVRLGIAVCNILLLENLYFNTAPEARWHVNLLCVALGGMFLYDLVLYSDAALFHAISRPLFESRAPAAMIAAPLIALAAVRDRRWKVDIHVSREVVFHSLTLVISGIFLMALALTGEVFRRVGAEWGHVVEVSMLCAGVATIAVMLTSGSMRSRIRGVLVDNFFSHRYDYRREWMRCIDTLTAPDAFVGLHKRAIRAVAEVVDSPAGVLFVRAPEDVAFQWAGSLNTPAVTVPIPPGHPLVPAFADGDRIAVLEELPDAASWFAEIPRAWLAVPLNHFGNLIGFVVLTRSRAQFKLDHEVFQLLRVVGREVASRVAEQRAAQILSQTRELREYSQRFAFVLHDIKNVSGQLSMLLANAEVHADNPEFQRDMLATVRASVGKITRLLTRLQADRRERSHALIDPVERLKEIVELTLEARPARGAGASHPSGSPNGQPNAPEGDRSGDRLGDRLGDQMGNPGGSEGAAQVGEHRSANAGGPERAIAIVGLTGDGLFATQLGGVAIDPESFDAVAAHLLNNAIEASPPTTQVHVEVRREALSMVIDIIDQGPGMSPEFIRDELFRPFASTKGDGHGVGVYQARELLREAGGDLLVLSRVGSGTTMRLLLPMVRAAADLPQFAA